LHNDRSQSSRGAVKKSRGSVGANPGLGILQRNEKRKKKGTSPGQIPQGQQSNRTVHTEVRKRWTFAADRQSREKKMTSVAKGEKQVKYKRERQGKKPVAARLTTWWELGG